MKTDCGYIQLDFKEEFSNVLTVHITCHATLQPHLDIQPALDVQRLVRISSLCYSNDYN